MLVSYNYLARTRSLYVVVALLIFGFGFTPKIEADTPWDARKAIIVFDPGHGGNDHGVVGPAGKTEKTVALSLARQLAAELTLDYQTVLTRKDDYALDLNERASLANQLEANLFISIHIGASFRPHVEGITIFYASTVTSGPAISDSRETNPATESRKNWETLQNDHVQDSLRMAEALKKSFSRQFPKVTCRVQQAPLAVLQGLDMPAVLVECGYLTNPAWEQAVDSLDFRQAFLAAMMDGIRVFLPPQQ